MRLSDHDRQFIREAAADIFGQGTRVRLFGSRRDDQARGGDVDLLVVSDHVLAERLGVLPSTEGWLAARKLRNRLVHEYMEDADGFAADIDSARAACAMLFDVYNRVIAYVRDRLGVAADALPAPLAPLGA